MNPGNEVKELRLTPKAGQLVVDGANPSDWLTFNDPSPVSVFHTLNPRLTTVEELILVSHGIHSSKLLKLALDELQKKGRTFRNLPFNRFELLAMGGVRGQPTTFGRARLTKRLGQVS